MCKVIIGTMALVMGAMLQIASAATFTANNGIGTSSIGINGDYGTLGDAAADFNSGPPLAGDYTFLINSDTTEPADVAFGKNTTSFTVTLRPAPSTSSTVTFTNIVKDAGWVGHLVIGTTSTQIAGDALTPTNNFIIDGCSTPGMTERNLRFVNTTAVPATVPTEMIRVAGSCDNVQIKNLYVENLSPGSGSTNRAIGIEYSSRHSASGPNGAGDFVPTNGLIQNCLVTCNNSLDPIGIYARTLNSTITPGIAQTGFQVIGNEIHAHLICVSLEQSAGCNIIGNDFYAGNGLAVRPEVVRHINCNGVTGWTCNILNNRWMEGIGSTATAAPGFNNCLELGAGLDASTGTGTYNVVNNTFGGFNLTGITVSTFSSTVAKNGLYHCIVVVTNNSSATLNIYHNSINMPDFPNLSAPGSLDRFGAIAFSGLTFQGTMNLFNNIIRCEQNNGVLVYRTAGGNGILNSDHNVFYLGTAGEKMASYHGDAASADSSTLADWQTAGFDASSLEINPTIVNSPAPGKWVLGAGDNDLHFDAKPVDGFGMPPIAGITTDIDGDSRSATQVYAGADERPEQLAASVDAWSMY